MKRLSRLLFSALLTAVTGPAFGGLLEYLGRPEPVFEWQLVESTPHGDGTVHALRLVSQTWRGIPWSHDVRVFVPGQVATPGTMLLVVTGGGAGDRLYSRMAREAAVAVAVLYQVPNQPLLDGKSEDDLIAETFLRFLATGEPDWPLLLPMTKSAVKAMDALQAFAAQHLDMKVDGFVVTGASKRGWTSWLAAASDPRVRGVAPLVIDMLNVPAQMEHQLASWGGYSEMLQPYTAPGLPSFISSAAGRRLLSVVDPYSYRMQLTMPKLIVLGTNDRYWTLDAMNLYWDELTGPKHAVYAPNTGHGLSGAGHWFDSLACFVRQVAAGDALPELAWRHARAADRLDIAVSSPQPAEGGWLWSASAPTRDFRDARWEAQPLSAGSATLRGATPLSGEEFTAAFAELHYRLGERDCYFSTQVRIEPPLAQ
jgi:PhoPQ-activated pathogenicity-related protein